MRFPRQDYWTGMPFPSPGDLSDPGTEPASPAMSSRFFTLSPLGSHRYIYRCMLIRQVLLMLHRGRASIQATWVLLPPFVMIKSELIYHNIMYGLT